MAAVKLVLASSAGAPVRKISRHPPSLHSTSSLGMASIPVSTVEYSSPTSMREGASSSATGLPVAMAELWVRATLCCGA